MARPTLVLNPSSPAVMSTLTWIRRQGFRPVPLHKASKAAINRDYVDPGYRPPDDELWRRSDYGVGVVTGTKHGGMVDGDLDCSEAVFLAPRFLPPTPATFGRASKRASHYLYRTSAHEMPKQAFVDPITGTTIIEIRADGGHQTVFPGSVHQDTGELVEWDGNTNPDVPTVDDEALYNGCRKVAVATLIVRHVWMEGQRNEACKHLAGMFYYLKWTEDEAVQLITAVMELTGDDDRTRLPTIRNTYKKGERGAKISGAGKLRKLLNDDRLVDRILEWTGSPLINLLQEYNERYAVVMVNNKFRIAKTDYEVSRPPSFYQRDDFLFWKASDTISVPGADKPVQKAKLWLSSNQHREYEDVDFLPGIEDPPGILNLWTGWAVQPAAGPYKAWMELLTDVVCGGDAALVKWMLHWFANIVREPMNKSFTAPVIIGNPGAGKSMMLSYFSRILGSASIVINNPKHITGQFNEHLALTLFLHSEEALYAGDKQHRSQIKSLITDEYRMYEPKNINAKQVKNYLRLCLTSNYQHAAPVEIKDRRFTVIDMKDRSIENTPLVDRVLKERDDKNGPAALFKYLLEMPYDPKLARTNVKNQALSNMKFASFDPIESWWHDTLAQGQVLPDYLAWATKPEKDDWPEIVSSSALHASMVIYMRDRSLRNTYGSNMFASQLDKMVCCTLTRMQRWYSNPQQEDAPQMVKLMSDRQSSVINMPPLADCRKAFEKHVGQKLEWPHDAPESERPMNKENY